MSFEILPDRERFPEFIMPKRGSLFSAGIDVFAQEDLVITEESQLIDLGFKASVPAEYGVFLLPRSGYGAKFGMALSNTVGLIDPDYRGTWMASLWLNGAGSKRESIENGFWDDVKCRHLRQLEIPRGEALGQLVIMRVADWEPTEVTQLSETVRGEGGFGSTNKVQH